MIFLGLYEWIRDPKSKAVKVTKPNRLGIKFGTTAAQKSPGCYHWITWMLSPAMFFLNTGCLGLQSLSLEIRHLFLCFLGCAYRDEQMSTGWPFSLLNDKQRVATRWGLSTNQFFFKYFFSEKMRIAWKAGKFHPPHFQIRNFIYPPWN